MSNPGYSNPQVQQLIEELESRLSDTESERDSLAQGQMSMYTQPNEENLIQYQLELKEDLDKLYHLLNGNQPKYDAKGELVWVEPKDNALRPFNQFGVQLIMQVMNTYLNRNTLLSNYDQDTINDKVLDFGIEISDMIYNRYEEMGMDTPEKIKLFPMIFREMVDMVHSAYQRSLKGMERDSIRTGRIVTQSGQINPYEGSYRPQAPARQGKNFSLLSPRSWFGG